MTKPVDQISDLRLKLVDPAALDVDVALGAKHAADHCSFFCTTFLREHPGIVMPLSHASWDHLAGEGSEVNQHFQEWLHTCQLLL